MKEFQLGLDFDQLVNETYALNPINDPEFPDSPGIFYRILQETYAYRIEAVAARNMKKEGPPPSFGPSVHFFETPSLELSQVIVNGLAHKRFPKREDIFYNISDPGENWWMLNEDNSFKILFRNYGLEESKDGNCLLLGPLGDSQVAFIRFQRLREFLKSCFPLSQLNVSSKMIQVITLRSKEGITSEGFEEFRNIWCKGEISENLFRQMKEKASLTVFHYLNELSVLRRFWIQVYEKC